MNKAAVAVVVIAIVALTILAVYGLCGSSINALQCVRDLAIIVLVVETFVVTLLLGVIVLLFGQLITTLRQEILPTLRSLQRTMGTVEGTTKFVSDTFVSPFINLAGFGAMLKGTVRAFFSPKKRGGPS